MAIIVLPYRKTMLSFSDTLIIDKQSISGPESSRTEEPGLPANKRTSGETFQRLVSQPLVAILLLIGAFFAISAIVLPVNRMSKPDTTVTVNIGDDASTQVLKDLPNLPTNVGLTPVSTNGLKVHLTASTKASGEGASLPWYLRFLAGLGSSVWAASLAAISILLALTLAAINGGNPFHPSNARRLTWIAALVVIGSAGSDSLNWLAARLAYNYLDLQSPLEVVAFYSIPPFLLAAVMLVLAQAFRRGRQIQDDVDGLV